MQVAAAAPASSQEAEEVIAVCRVVRGKPEVEAFGYYRLHADDERFMYSVAPVDDQDPATVVSGSLDMSVREFLSRLREGDSALVRRLVGAK